MSRQKSNRTLLLEQERAARKAERIRKREEKKQTKKTREERRLLKFEGAEAKRKERLRRKTVRESVERNGTPKVQEGGTYLGIREAIEYSPLVLCPGCRQAIRDTSMIGPLCERCHFLKEVNDPEPELKAQGDKGLPVVGERELKPDGPVGQLTLSI